MSDEKGQEKALDSLEVKLQVMPDVGARNSDPL